MKKTIVLDWGEGLALPKIGHWWPIEYLALAAVVVASVFLSGVGCGARIAAIVLKR